MPEVRGHAEMTMALLAIAGRRKTLLAYRDECARIGDHHGVQDASSDLRELDAAEAALRWVLGERGNVGQ